MRDISKIRNIGIIAHIDAGKTTTTERILYYTKATYKMGNVDDGNTVTDYLPDEQKMGITITSAAIKCHWRDGEINLIDTPGHIDFTAEVERSLRVLDGAVVIFCAVGGVEAQSETVWRQANRYRVPRIVYINKMDRIGAHFEKVLSAMKKRLGAEAAVIAIPWGSESGFAGIIDVIGMQSVVFQGELGSDVIRKDILTSGEIPTELVEEAKSYRERLVNQLADLDDSIIEKYSNGSLLSEDIQKSLRKATLDQKLFPVLPGASFRHKGVQCLLDAVLDYLPSPLDVPPIVGFHPKNQKNVSFDCQSESLCALAFKTTFDKHGDITYLRIYSGEVTEGMQVYNPGRDKTERINRLGYFFANRLNACEVAGPGDIVGAIGLRYTKTGDTLCRKSHPVLLEKMVFPQTVISKTIEPKVTADKDKLLKALEIISRDDPTFLYTTDEESAQILIHGMGELHLDIIHNRIYQEHNISVKLGTPRVSYRETIGSSAEAESVMDKQFANKEHFARLRVRVEPCKEGTRIQNCLASDIVPQAFYPAIEEGVKSALSSGEIAGYPVANVRVSIVAGESNAVRSSEMAFTKVAFEATRLALQKAKYLLLEPVMSLRIQTPVSYVGDVLSDLNCRRARVEEIEMEDQIQNIGGKVPLAEMFGYANSLRTLTQGRAAYSMEPFDYEVAPKEIQDKMTF